MSEEEKERYADMFDLPHHRSPTRAHMSAHNRAAQFSAFAALSGYQQVIAEAARQTQERVELGEDEIAALDACLRQLQQEKEPMVSITYFCPDERKSGGIYRTQTGRIARIDSTHGRILFTDGAAVPIPEIRALRQEDTEEIFRDFSQNFDEAVDNDRNTN